MKIFLADDDPLLRKGLRMALSQDPDTSVIGEAGDGLTAIKKIQNQTPDLVLVDLDMPGLSGFEVIRLIRKVMPQMKIIVLSSHTDKRDIRNAFAAGADRYVMKCVENAKLAKIIKSLSS